MLHIKHLTKYYTKSKPIISDMNLSFPSTGLNIIVGKSGCGKTTLLNMIGTMDQDYIGSIELDGVELSRFNYSKITDFRSYDSAYIFQINSLFEHLTVRQNIQLVLDLQQKEANIDEVLEQVGLKGFANKKVKYLSGGERQRVGIARAIAKDSKIILADEPTSALDSKNAHRILQLLKEISKDKLVIVVTHDVKKALVYADRIIKLVDGRVVEDQVINQSSQEAKSVQRKSPRKRVLLPIFFEQFRKSLVINLFIMLLVGAALAVFNIGKEQAKIKAEYDRFYELQEKEDQFSKFEIDMMRMLLTQEANNVNMYQVLQADAQKDPYYHLANVTSITNNLEPSDHEVLNSLLKGYDTSNFDSKYGGLIIDGISIQLRGTVTIMGRPYYWSEPQRTPYTHLIHQEGNTYDLKYGSVPVHDNEILITDTIADHYLRNFNLDNSDLSVMLNQELTIRDIYGIGYRDLSTSSSGPAYVKDFPYYHTVGKTFKITGIIETNQLQYYEYLKDGNTYTLTEQIYKQIGTSPYMNDFYMQPYGYVVLKDALDAAKTKVFTDIPLKLSRVLYRGQSISQSELDVSVFQGYNDYRGFFGYDDNLSIDVKSRLIARNQGISELTGNQIIISRQLLERYTAQTWTESRIRSSYESEIQGQEITLTFDTVQGLTDITFEIAGISQNSSTNYFYVSTEVLGQLREKNSELNPSAMLLDLTGVSAKDRMKLIEKLHKAGYLLSPKNCVPGAYLEFVPTQGEIEEIDEEGYIEKKNISLYHLFSLIYNTEDMDSMNAALEIVDSIANFVLVLSITISLGFIYLKERRQRINITKLSQIGVSSKSIIWMNMLTYLVVAVAIGVVGYFATHYVVDYINSIFTLSIGKASIYRFRIIATNITLTSTILAVAITSLIGMIASVVFVKKSRR